MSLGVVYLLAVLLVATVWGLWLGIATAVASALAFNYFHIPPTGKLSIEEGEHWVALAVFFVTAIVASELAERARQQAQRGRRAAARGGPVGRDGAPAAACRTICARRWPRAHIGSRPPSICHLHRSRCGSVDAGERRVAFPLREGARQIGTLLVPADLPESRLRRLQERVVPPLEALLAAALERDQLLVEPRRGSRPAPHRRSEDGAAARRLA